MSKFFHIIQSSFEDLANSFIPGSLHELISNFKNGIVSGVSPGFISNYENGIVFGISPGFIFIFQNGFNSLTPRFNEGFTIPRRPQTVSTVSLTLHNTTKEQFHRQLSRRRYSFIPHLLILIAALLTITGCGNGKSAENRYPDTLSRYDYRATRQLILFVRRGADLVREKGPAAFEIMRNDPKTWKTEESYIYVYSIEGRCLYHGGMPEIEAQNLFDIIDTSGKKPIQQVIQATEDPANPDGWVHFTWTIPNRFYEVEKSSCHYRVTMPDGQIVLVGGGLTEPPEEREFARCAVDSAIRLIEKKGDKALDEIRQAGSRFRYRNVSVFVLAPDGTALVDPGIRLQTPRNLTDFIDDVGNRPFHNAYQRLKKENRIWLVVLTHSRYDRNLNKRAIYLRLSTLNGQDIMVGATVPVPKPAWSS